MSKFYMVMAKYIPFPMIMHGNRDTPPGESVVMLTLRAFPLKPG